MPNGTLNNTSDNTAQDNQPVFREWYSLIKKIIFGEKNDENETTFLQVFFSPALYCNEIQEVCTGLRKTQTKEQISQKFYASFSLGQLKEELQALRRNATLNAVNQKISNQLAGIIKSKNFEIYEEIENECDDKGRLKKAKQTIYYKKNFIFNHYVKYSKFYIEFIAVILEALHKIGLVTETEKLINSIRNAITKKKEYGLNTYSSDNEFKNAAYYVWNFVLLRIDSEYMTEGDSLSRLWDESNDKIRKDLNNYASVLEYYPVNTVERFGALKDLASKDNLYAMQELYFLYLNDTVLYNTSGEMKFILKSSLSESEMLFTELKKKGENFLPAFFRHEKNYDQKKFVLSVVHRHKAAYKNYNEKQLKNMMKELTKIYCDKSIPFNTELIWFIKNLFDEYDSLQKSFSLEYHMIQTQLLNNPWIAELMNSASSDSTIELHELLFLLYQKDIFKGDDILLSICHEFSNGDTELLEHYRTLAEKKLLEYYAMKIAAKRNKVDSEEINIRSELWTMVFDILSRAIDNEKQQ